MPGLAQTLTLGQLAAAARGGSLLPEAAPMPPALGRVLAGIMLADVRERFATTTDPAGVRWKPLSRPRVNGGDKPLNDTGVLRASLHGGSDATAAYVATTHPAAAIHNAGGTIRPVRARMLAIPLTKEAKRAGSPRRFPGGLAFRPTRKRRVFLLVGGSGAVKQGQFLLVDQVVIPQREFMGLSEKGWGYAAEAVAESRTAGWVDGRPVTGVVQL